MDGVVEVETDGGAAGPARRSAFARLVLDLRAGRISRDQLATALHDAQIEPSTARALISAQRTHSNAYLFGAVTGTLRLNDLRPANLWIFAEIDGDVELSGSSGCNVVVGCAVAGDVVLSDAPAGAVRVSGDVEGLVRIDGSIAGDLRIDGSASRGVWIPGSVGGTLAIAGRAGGTWIYGSVLGSVAVTGTLTNELCVGKAAKNGRWKRGEVWGGLSIAGVLHRGLRVDGRVREALRISGRVGGEVTLAGELHDDVWVTGHVKEISINGQVLGRLTVTGVVAEAIRINGNVVGRVAMSGSTAGSFAVTGAAGPLWLTGRFGGDVIIRPDQGADGNACVRIVSMMRAQFAGDVHLGDHVDISGCDFRQVSDLQRLRLVGAHLFPRDHRRLSNPPESWHEHIPDRTMEPIYRQLRLNLEASHQRVLASALFVEEMDARRRALIERERLSVERLLLSSYRWLSNYSTSVLRPLLWFAAIALIGAGVFTATGLSLSPDGTTASGVQMVTFAAQSMLSAFWPPGPVLGAFDQWVQIALRVAGPMLIVQFVLALRSQIAR